MRILRHGLLVLVFVGDIGGYYVIRGSDSLVQVDSLSICLENWYC